MHYYNIPLVPYSHFLAWCILIMELLDLIALPWCTGKKKKKPPLCKRGSYTEKPSSSMPDSQAY